MTVPAILPAVAQDEEESDVLEEITVTARKRSVDIQKAPIAVSSVGADVMEQSAVVKLDDFNTYVPGLTIAKNDGAGRVVAIRGVGWETAQNLGTQPGVLVYIDGVYLANPLAMGLDLGEIERVEVLRGPQGTEFGQSATGGAVNIITKKARPGEQGGSLDVQAGTYSYYKGRASLQVAPGERSGLHVSVQKGVRDGFAEIKGGALDGYELDDYDATTAHLSFTWTPKSNVGVTLSGFWQDSDQNGAAQRHLDDPNPDPRELTQDYPSTFALTNTSLSAIIDWRLPSGLTFKSLTGWQKLEKDQTVDGDRLTTDLVSVNLTGFFANNFDILPYWINDSDAFSQEFNLTSRTDKLDWVVGLYYLDHENFNDFLEAVAPGTPEDYADQLANPGPDTLPPFQPPLEFVETRKLTREDSAVYGQMTYRISDRTALTLGGRYQRDESTDDSTQFWFTESLQVLEDEAFTWKLGLDFDVNDTQLVYALLSTGWKNGGNNPGALSGALDTPPQFEPEEVTALEIGVKNTLAGDRARFNVTGFYYDYENYQFVQEDPVPFAGGAGNIPSLTIFGVEGEWNWLIDERWRLDGFFSLSDGEVDSDLAVLDTVDFLNSGFGRFTETGVADRASLRVNLRGNVPPKLVEESGRIALSYNRPFGGNSLFIGRVDVQHRGEFQYRVFNHPDVDTVPDYTIANLYFEADFGNMPLEVSLSVTNLTDEDGVNSRFSNPYGLHTTSDELIPPRQVIARFRYSF
ncbi:MAG: TonB-dependent receptor [Acidobacteriota bacterium]|nr:TonB-dependent receptor [Acidobacteriota bacterium]